METAIVTGASSGIGRAVAQKLAEKGFEVYGMARHFDETYPRHPGIVPVVCDLGDLEALVESTRQVLEARDALHLLVNNAGVGFFGPHEALSPAQLEEMVRTNLLAPLMLTRETLRHLRASKGTVINIASTAAVTPHRLGAAYAATKAGLHQFGRALFEEVRRSGVKVVTLLPDMTRTDFYRHARFEPSGDEACHITPACAARAVAFVLEQRSGTVVTEITLKPARVKIETR